MLFRSQLTGFEEWLEITEVEAHTAAFFDTLLTPDFYNLVAGPVCGYIFIVKRTKFYLT